jgi:hypothetical protein
MALYADGKGRYGTQFGQLWSELVPDTGDAETIQGEAVRIIGRLASEYYRNGNMNWDEDFLFVAQWLRKTLNDETVFSSGVLSQINADIDRIIHNGQTGECPYEDGEDEYDRITDRVVEYCHQNLKPIENDSELPL